MTVIPCARDERLRAEIDRFAEVLKTQAHTLGAHGLDEKDFYNSGVLRGAVELKTRNTAGAAARVTQPLDAGCTTT